MWGGYYDNERYYAPGEVVVRDGHVYMAKTSSVDCINNPTYWAFIGRQENAKIDHYYHPEAIQFPLPTGDMSESTYICSDCWHNGNFAAAFMPDEHRYLISELPG